MKYYIISKGIIFKFNHSSSDLFMCEDSMLSFDDIFNFVASCESSFSPQVTEAHIRDSNHLTFWLKSTLNKHGMVNY